MTLKYVIQVEKVRGNSGGGALGAELTGCGGGEAGAQKYCLDFTPLNGAGRIIISMSCPQIRTNGSGIHLRATALYGQPSFEVDFSYAGTGSYWNLKVVDG